MAKADTGELFLSRHTETYICRPGENVLLECYVRHQRVKSIIWYANGELVEVRGFRLWHRYHPTTGKCSLYIRSVLYSDEGSYCCQATSIDGDIEILEIKLLIQNCKQYEILFLLMIFSLCSLFFKMINLGRKFLYFIWQDVLLLKV